jgi:hypothetical protein
MHEGQTVDGRWVEINGERIWIPFGAIMGTEMIDPEQRNRKPEKKHEVAD